MAQPERFVTPVPEPLPAEVEIDLSSPMVPHTSAEITMLKVMTGKRYQELVGEGADDGERFQVMVWLRLRRLGFQPTWAEAGDVVIKWVNVPEDPTNAADLTTLPASVVSGASAPPTLTDS